MQQSYFWPLALQSHFERVLEEKAKAAEETRNKYLKEDKLICVRIAGTNILGECSSFLKDIGCSAAWLAIGLLTRSRSKDDQFLFQAFLPVRFQVSSLVVFVLCSFIRCQIVNRRMKKLRQTFTSVKSSVVIQDNLLKSPLKLDSVIQINLR